MRQPVQIPYRPDPKNYRNVWDMIVWCEEQFRNPGPGRWQIDSDMGVFLFWDQEQAVLFALRGV